MDAAELRAMQAPIKERYKQDPSAAVITLKAKGSTDTEGLTCKVETGRALAVAGLHPATGGSGLELCSGDMLLEALVACAGVTLKAVATTLGVDKEAAVGFKSIRLAFDIETAAPDDSIAQLIKLTERYCVVYQTLNKRPDLQVRVNRAS